MTVTPILLTFTWSTRRARRSQGKPLLAATFKAMKAGTSFKANQDQLDKVDPPGCDFEH